jgi:hypothetical protein
MSDFFVEFSLRNQVNHLSLPKAEVRIEGSLAPRLRVPATRADSISAVPAEIISTSEAAGDGLKF